jgi:hypothetical protein
VTPDRARARYAILAAVNCLFAEFDAKDYGDKAAIRAHIATLPLAPSVTVDSGGGLHCYFLLDKPLILHDAGDVARARDLQWRWVELCGGDGGAKDLCRVLRVPGTRNFKPAYGPDFPTVKIVDATGALYSLAQLEAVLPVKMPDLPKPAAARVVIPLGVYDREHDHAMRVIAGMVADAQDGAKHEALYRAARLAGGYAGAGVGSVDAWRRQLEQAIDARANVKDTRGAYRTIADGLRDGQLVPVILKTAARVHAYTEPQRAKWQRRVIVHPGRRFPLTLTLPPDRAAQPGLALPNGQWRRLADGALEVTYTTPAQLQTCLDATAAIRAGVDNGNP